MFPADRFLLLVTSTEQPGPTGRSGWICSVLCALSSTISRRMAFVRLRKRVARSSTLRGMSSCAVPRFLRNTSRTSPLSRGVAVPPLRSTYS
jgi:hypothetical protein